jgi:hypothetical protein
MQVISNINPELKVILEEFSSWFFNSDYQTELIPHEKLDDNEKGEYATSGNYLKEALKDPKAYGYPKHMLGAVMENNLKSKQLQSKTYREACDSVDKKLINYFGARNNALRAYYPPSGYIGWHHNANAPGYNIVITCNPDGDGEFEHYDKNTNLITRYPDKKGWFVKVGYFGSFEEPEKMYWHCARTRSPRLTLSYIVPHADIWQSMIADIGIPDTTLQTTCSIL